MGNDYVIGKGRQWTATAVLAASEVPLGATKKIVAAELYRRLKEAIRTMVIASVNETPTFGGYSAYTAKIVLKHQTMRNDFISRQQLAGLALECRANTLGNRIPTPEELRLWEAAEMIAGEKAIPHGDA